MTTIITFLLAVFRRDLKGWFVDREIYNHVFPTLSGEKGRHYPFSSDDELDAFNLKSLAQLRARIDGVERACKLMPKAYGLAFRYICHRNLSQTLTAWEKTSEGRVPKKNKALLDQPA